MRPAPAPPQWRKIAAGRMSSQPSASVRRRLKSKAPYANLLRRLLGPRRFSRWLSTAVQRFAMALTLDAQSSILAAMQTPVVRLTDELCGLVRLQMDHPEVLPLRPLPQHTGIGIGTRHTTAQDQENAGLVDKTVTWMLAPVFFCCIVAEKAKPPQSWEATEVFSRVVVSFMLKLFVLATDLTGGHHQRQSMQRFNEDKQQV
ncbi:hypothetical protein PHYSODRAFT_330490 [Phytophthora sojae]|uniref:Uncharacterized protein n=1 Tax=Phytophthora sojae (strain P6497) TaxID=1094619 RepID=G4ZC20_PHYSP|nr:hypothetical protein PHYSODRAFT_330490 [Phytophthora sojae]EGZ22750.1 hypothetical protein PHYSODRAFT_330490 [Phytophthora sojae]|eukprot:XP_009525467.1 hypothetical protein PHYSODRAFT_330490 [Phytophthora sojae]